MIENPTPSNWKSLQSGVCELFKEIGLAAEVERKVKTPRGEIEIDVYAVDEGSVDQISYLVECKNWGKAISQSVVHAFTTVMHETGGNIGFIVSQKGLQSGARKYVQNTNIIGLTYLELQQRYFELWWSKCFVVIVGALGDDLIQYVEPINSRRDRFVAALSPDKREAVARLQKRYERFMMGILVIGFSRSVKELVADPHSAVAKFKQMLKQAGIEEEFSSIYFRDLAYEIGARALAITKEFNAVFGQNIFSKDARLAG